MTTETTIETPGTIRELASAGDPWRRLGEQYLSELYQRSGSERTRDEYGRYVARFLHGLADPAQATPGMVHAFAYAPTQRGTTPRPSTVMVR
ncbi:MAG TPA: hypothetical protein VGW38_25465, partial [Chloroflexota bacterium]|nr:hypothetical protein [Chloroflexota bacterium]